MALISSFNHARAKVQSREASLCRVNQSMIQVELRGLSCNTPHKTLCSTNSFQLSYSFFASIRTGISPVRILPQREKTFISFACFGRIALKRCRPSQSEVAGDLTMAEHRVGGHCFAQWPTSSLWAKRNSLEGSVSFLVMLVDACNVIGTSTMLRILVQEIFKG